MVIAPYAAMKIMTALEAKNAFGQFLETAQREPVTITRNGRSELSHRQTFEELIRPV